MEEALKFSQYPWPSSNMARRPKAKGNGVFPLRSQGEGFIERGHAVDFIDVHPEPGRDHFEGLIGKVFIPILNIVKDADEGGPLLLIPIDNQINRV
jgi:hypothetical protein